MSDLHSPGAPFSPSSPFSPGEPSDPLYPGSPGGPTQRHKYMQTQGSIATISGFIYNPKVYRYFVSMSEHCWKIGTSMNVTKVKEGRKESKAKNSGLVGHKSMTSSKLMVHNLRDSISNPMDDKMLQE